MSKQGRAVERHVKENSTFGGVRKESYLRGKISQAALLRKKERMVVSAHLSHPAHPTLSPLKKLHQHGRKTKTAMSLWGSPDKIFFTVLSLF